MMQDICIENVLYVFSYQTATDSRLVDDKVYFIDFHTSRQLSLKPGCQPPILLLPRGKAFRHDYARSVLIRRILHRQAYAVYVEGGYRARLLSNGIADARRNYAVHIPEGIGSPLDPSPIRTVVGGQRTRVHVYLSLSSDHLWSSPSAYHPVLAGLYLGVCQRRARAGATSS